MVNQIKEKITPRLELDRFDGGFDHGVQRRCLAETTSGHVQLYIVPGHQMRVGGTGSTEPIYMPTQLVLQFRDVNGMRRMKDLAEGRISKAVLRQHADTIDEYFGCSGLAQALGTSWTILVEDREAA